MGKLPWPSRVFDRTIGAHGTGAGQAADTCGASICGVGAWRKGGLGRLEIDVHVSRERIDVMTTAQTVGAFDEGAVANTTVWSGQPQRGDVWLCDLNPVRGREQAGTRPVSL